MVCQSFRILLIRVTFVKMFYMFLNVKIYHFLGGEVGLARECIKSILSGNGHLIMWKNETHQSKKQTRLSDIFLPGRSSCQVSSILRDFSFFRFSLRLSCDCNS